MAETKKENVRNIQFLASSIHRKNSKGDYVEKGGGADGSYPNSKVELRIPEVSSPFFVSYYGNKPTVIASVNALEARAHNDNKETVFVMLKNHVGWTKGMIRLHRITFVDEREANFFLSTYNLLAATIGRKEVADEVAIVDLLEDVNLDEDEDEESAEQDKGGKEVVVAVKQHSKDCAEEVLVKDGGLTTEEEDEDSIVEEMPNDHPEEDNVFDDDEDDDSFGPMTQEYPDGEFTSS
eukprot:scaffold1523_cov259-Chaetoceros_neogracile.AAC.1